LEVGSASVISYKHDITLRRLLERANQNIFCLSGTLTPEVRDNGDGTYDVTYVPPPEGSSVKAKITWDGKDIPNRYGDMYVRVLVKKLSICK
jgi:Filamin/ABP280 repeat.